MKKRIIDPEMFSDDRLASCGSFGLTLYMGLLCSSDVEGRLEDRPAKIKAKIFPYFDVDVNQVLTLLSTQGLIIRYKVGAVSVIQIVGFSDKKLSYNNEKSYDLPAYVKSKDEVLEATDQLVTNCDQADSQLNININNNILNNITRGECEGGKAKPKSLPAVLVLPDNLEEARGVILEWLEYKKERKKEYKPTGLKSLVARLSEVGAVIASKSIKNSMANNWEGLFFEETGSSRGNSTNFLNSAERTKNMIDRVINEEEQKHG